jgi:hypothetical protein
MPKLLEHFKKLANDFDYGDYSKTFFKTQMDLEEGKKKKLLVELDKMLGKDILDSLKETTYQEVGVYIKKTGILPPFKTILDHLQYEKLLVMYERIKNIDDNRHSADGMLKNLLFYLNEDIAKKLIELWAIDFQYERYQECYKYGYAQYSEHSWYSRQKIYNETENTIKLLEEDLVNKHKIAIISSETTNSSGNVFSYFSSKIKTFFNKNIIEPSAIKTEESIETKAKETIDFPL